jgi:hypothetical protein
LIPSLFKEESIMKKSILAGLILFTIFGSLASAQAPIPTPSNGGPLTLTGQVSLQVGNPFAVLKAGSDVWTLMVPRYTQAELPLKDGITVAVTGYETTHPQWGVQNGVRFLMVSQVTIAGKEYVLGNSLGYRPGQGGWGMMGGRAASSGGCGW